MKKNKLSLILSLVLVLLSVFSIRVFAADGAGETDWSTITIVFIVITVVEFFAVLIMAAKYKKLNKKLKVEENLHSFAFATILAFTQGLFVLFLVLAIAELIAICELAYLISNLKVRLAEEHKISLEKEKELQERISSGNMSYMMTVEEWYNLEKETCERLVRKNNSPLEYLTKELEKEEHSGNVEENRLSALKDLYKEYSVVSEN